MEHVMNPFRYTSYAQEVIFGAGAFDQLGQAVDRFHRQRLLLCTSGSARRAGLVARTQAACAQAALAHTSDAPHAEKLMAEARAALVARQARADLHELDSVLTSTTHSA